MRYINIKVVVLLFVVAITSCSESLLDKDPIGDYTSDDYLNTEEECESAIYGVYDALQTSYNGNAWNSPFLLYNVLGDDINAGGGTEGDQTQFQNMDKYVHGVSNPAVESVFHDYYTIVQSANTIINRMSKELSNSAQIEGEAKFFRAFAYFHLVRAWGDVPYYTENAANLDEPIGKTDKETIYGHIEKDLTDAIALLSLKSELAAGHKFRIAKGAAQSLLGKVYLYQEKYALAHQTFAKVIASTQYDLEDNFTEIWDADKRGGDESIFEILYTSQNNVDWGGPWDGTAESNFIVELSGPRGDNSFRNFDAVNKFFAEGKATSPESKDFKYKYTDVRNGWGFCVPTKKVGIAIYKEAAQTRERIDGSLISEEDFEAAGGHVNDEGYTEGGKTMPKGANNWKAYEGYIRLKWTTRQSHTSAGGVSDLNFQTPFKMIRYADVLLMAAEAYNKDNKDAQAIEELKKLSDRAGFANYNRFENLSGDALFEYIVNERFVELAFEGHRFFDLVRWGKAAEELGDLGFKSGKNELLPLPKAEFDLNGGLDPSAQNPGY